MAGTLTENQIVVDGLLLTYYLSEEGSSQPPVLLLHGWRAESTLWFPLAQKLHEYGHTVYALDLPGFGKSQKPQDSWDLQSYYDIVVKFLQKLEITEVIVIGHSFGGSIGILLASQSPKLVSKLILINSSGIRKSSSTKNIKIIIAKMVKPLFQISFMKPLRTKIYKFMGAEDYVATPELKDIFVRIVTTDLTPFLSQITTKTLLLWGEKDMDTPISYGRIMQEKIPQSKLISYPDAGHFSFLDKPDECSEEIINFLKS